MVSRLQKLFEITSLAISEEGKTFLEGKVTLQEVLEPIAHSILKKLTQRFNPFEIRESLQETITVPAPTVILAAEDAWDSLHSIHDSHRDYLLRILIRLPDGIRQALRRPGDSAGISIPEKCDHDSFAAWLSFLPDRLPRFTESQKVELLDDWQLESWCGWGNYGEVWKGVDEKLEGYSPACLKFITEPRLQKSFRHYENYFHQILNLDPQEGMIPLRAVYLLTDPPCLESVFIPGYDLCGLMNDWRWRYDSTRPEQALLIIRRLARILRNYHEMNPPIVHGGLKPSNVLVSQLPSGKQTIWISDLGWGEISTAYSLRISSSMDAIRQARRGSYAPLYASPQLKQGQSVTPADDVYALGVIWYQILMRDPTAAPPTNPNWSDPFQAFDLSLDNIHILNTCLAVDPKHRYPNARVLADHIENIIHMIRSPGNSKTFQLGGSSLVLKPLDTANIPDTQS